MSHGKTVLGAFRRSSSAVSIVIIVGFVTMIISTAYHTLAFTPAEFIEKPEVQKYENELEKLPPDEWTRTQYYWSNNLGVAGVYALWTPLYLGFNSVVANSYRIGMDLTYHYHQYGPEIMLAFSAMVFVHGLLELTGIYLIAAVSLRLAWNFWKGLGGLARITNKEEKHRVWKLTKREKREILKHKHAIKMLLSDFAVLFVVGVFFVFLAAPIEAYVSPAVGYGFIFSPVAAAVFLVEVGLIYALIAALGFNRMRGDLKYVWNEVRLAFRRKWRPAQLSLLIFVIFSAVMLLRFML